MNFMKKIQAIALAGLMCSGVVALGDGPLVNVDFAGFDEGNFFAQLDDPQDPWEVNEADESEIVEEGNGYALKLSTEGNELKYNVDPQLFDQEPEGVVSMKIKLVGTDTPPTLPADNKIKVALYYNNGETYLPYIAANEEEGYWAVDYWTTAEGYWYLIGDEGNSVSSDPEDPLYVEDEDYAWQETVASVHVQENWTITKAAFAGQSEEGTEEGLYAYVTTFDSNDQPVNGWVLLKDINVVENSWVQIDITVSEEELFSTPSHIVKIEVNGTLATGDDGGAWNDQSDGFVRATWNRADAVLLNSVSFMGTGMVDFFVIDTEPVEPPDTVLFDDGSSVAMTQALQNWIAANNISDLSVLLTPGAHLAFNLSSASNTVEFDSDPTLIISEIVVDGTTVSIRIMAVTEVEPDGMLILAEDAEPEFENLEVDFNEIYGTVVFEATTSLNPADWKAIAAIDIVAPTSDPDFADDGQEVLLNLNPTTYGDGTSGFIRYKVIAK